MNNMEFCGVEVSAQQLVVAANWGQQQVRLRQFANTAGGHRALVRALQRRGGVVRVVLEATGLYGLDVALALSAEPGLEVMVANPRAVRHFAQALMQRSKNDRLDAMVLREFALRMPFTRWARPSAPGLQVWAMARRLEALTAVCTAEKNRAHAAGVSQSIPVVVRQDIARSLRFHQRAIQRLRQQALACIAAEEQLRKRFRLLCSIPGVGQASAIQILAELLLLPADRDVRQWIAYAGLDPREYLSGTSVRKRTRISRVGNRHLRHALFMPALVASRREPHLRGFYEHLLARGKSKRQALTAVARKLLHAMYGMFRSGQPYDGGRVYRLPSAVPKPIAA